MKKGLERHLREIVYLSINPKEKIIFNQLPRGSLEKDDQGYFVKFNDKSEYRFQNKGERIKVPTAYGGQSSWLTVVVPDTEE